MPNQLNASDHKPLTCRIKVTISNKTQQMPDKPVHKGKPNWKKCDLEIYRNTLKQKLQDTKLETNSLTEHHTEIRSFTFDHKRSRKNSLSKQKQL